MPLRATLLRPLLLVALPVGVLGVLAAIWLAGRPHVATENAYVKAHIVHVAPEVAGRIGAVRVRNHAPVAKGDVLVELDPEPFRLALAKADGELEQARLQVETLRATFVEAEAELKEAQGRLAYAEQQLARQKQLAGRGVVPAIKLEEMESNAVAARDRVQVLRQKVARTLASLAGDPQLPAERHGLVREKQAARDRAERELSETVVKAPVGGITVGVQVQPGEQVRAATAMFSIVADSRPWVEANFKETDLANVRPGHPAEVTLDVYPGLRWQAVVESISPATGAEFAILPPQNASGNWVKIVQRLPVRLRLIERPGEPVLRAGMTAHVSIDTGEQRRIATFVSWWRTPEAQADGSVRR